MNTIPSDSPPNDSELQDIDARNSRKYIEQYSIHWSKNPHDIQNKFSPLILQAASLYSKKSINELKLIQGGATLVNQKTDCIAFIVEDSEKNSYVVVANFNGTQLLNYTCYKPS